MTESMERARVSRRSFLGGVGVTAGGLMVDSGPVFWQQAAKADTVTAPQPGATKAAEYGSSGAVPRGPISRM